MSSQIIPSSLGDLFSFRKTLSRRAYVIRIVVINVLIGALMFYLVDKITEAKTVTGTPHVYDSITWTCFAAFAILLVIALAQMSNRARDIGWPAWSPIGYIVFSTIMTLAAAEYAGSFVILLINIASVIAGMLLAFMPGAKPKAA